MGRLIGSTINFIITIERLVRASFPANVGKKSVSCALREVLKATRRHDEGPFWHSRDQNFESAARQTGAAFAHSLRARAHDLAATRYLQFLWFEALEHVDRNRGSTAELHRLLPSSISSRSHCAHNTKKTIPSTVTDRVHLASLGGR